MGRTACTELQCLYKGVLYFYLYLLGAYTKELQKMTIGFVIVYVCLSVCRHG